RGGVADHLDVVLALEQEPQALTDHVVVVEQVDADLLAHGDIPARLPRRPGTSGRKEPGDRALPRVNATGRGASRAAPPTRGSCCRTPRAPCRRCGTRASARARPQRCWSPRPR